MGVFEHSRGTLVLNLKASEASHCWARSYVGLGSQDLRSHAHGEEESPPECF